MNRSFIKIIYIYIFLIIISAWGCSNLPDIVSTEKNKGEKYSADEVRYLTIDQPSMASGDYFRERNQEPGIDPLKFFSKSSSKKIKTAAKKQDLPEKTKKPVSAPEKIEVKKAQPVSEQHTEKFPTKVGLIIDRNNIRADTTNQIYKSAETASKDLNIIISEKQTIEEALAQLQCKNPKDLMCITKSLGVYPGIRTIILIEKYVIPDKFPGTLLAVIGVADTGLGFVYPFMEIKVPVNAKPDLNAIMPGIMRNILDFAQNKSGIMPWFCRAFSHENNEWYITAGKQSGLKPGDSLKVIKGGKLVKSPAGMPAGWIPGTEKGFLKVQTLFAKDFAVCTLEKGAGPDERDILIMPQGK